MRGAAPVVTCLNSWLDVKDCKEPTSSKVSLPYFFHLRKPSVYFKISHAGGTKRGATERTLRLMRSTEPLPPCSDRYVNVQLNRGYARFYKSRAGRSTEQTAHGEIYPNGADHLCDDLRTQPGLVSCVARSAAVTLKVR